MGRRNGRACQSASRVSYRAILPPEPPEEGWWPDFPEDPPDQSIPEEDEQERFRGIVEQAKALGDMAAAADPATLTVADLEELEARLVDLAKVDPSCFARYVFEWPIQRCHVEWQDFLTENDRAILWAPIEHGKTSQVSIARPLYELGRNPALRVALISSTEGQASKSLSVVKQQIELNPRLHRVFPLLRRERRAGHRQLWHDTAIIVRRDEIDLRDPSVQALGVYSALIGSRVDLGILDDILDFENTLHETGRKRTVQWFDASVESRMTAFARLWLIGTAWNRGDAMHVLANRPGWQHRRYDAWEQNLWPDLVQIGGKWCGWPRWRLEKRRETTPAAEFNRQFRNRTTAPGSRDFKLEEVEACYTGTPWDPTPLPSEHYYVGVDLSVLRKKGADDAVFFVGELLPDGSRRVQFIVAEPMKLSDIVWWFFRIEQRFHPVLFLVENNAAQDYVVQLFQPDMLHFLEARHGLPSGELAAYAPRVEGFYTGSNKGHPEIGIRGMTLEFEKKRWSIPRHEVTARWVTQLEEFDPSEHTGDILMASWFFHSACLKYKPRRLRAGTIGGNR